MSRLTERFEYLRKNERTALAPYFMGGYPDLETSFALIREAVRAGADLIELGMPFSDPLADGPTIQKAGQTALRNPFTLKDLMERFGQEQDRIPIPVVLMTYYNLVVQLGLDETASLAAKAGISGFIVPDLPIEESAPFDAVCRDHGLDLVNLVAPTSDADRVREIDSRTSGMLYYVCRIGVTGARESLPEGLVDSLDSYRALTTHPSVVGFGISKPEHVRALKEHTDGIVIASAIIRELEAYEPDRLEESVRAFLEPISEVLD